MPFDPRTKSRKTTTLPAALRDELGLPAPSAGKRNFKPHDRRFDSRQHGKPQLKAIGKPQSAINGAAKGAPRGPIKSLRNQEKEQQEQQKQRHQPQQRQQQQQQSRPKQHNHVNSKSAVESSSSSRQLDSSVKSSKRKHEEKPEKELKVIKKPKSTQTKASEEAQEPPKTRLNPFTGELETVQPTKKKTLSSNQTALEKMLARAEAGPSISSKGKAKASDGLGGALKKKSRRHMSQQEKEEEDEIRWLEYSLGKSRQGEDVVRDDLDDFLDDLDRFQVGMYDGSSEDEDESDQEEVGESEDSGLEEVSASESEEESEEDSDEEVSEEDESDVEAEEELRDGMDEEGMFDFDSNDEDDFSNWDAAMATTDEEAEAEDDEEEDSDEESEELDSEAEEARALISGTATATTSSSSSPALAPSPAAQTTATKYIPPALRAKLAAESSSSTTAPSTSASASSGPGVTETEMDPLAAQKLRRQAQGLLNRLGDANIDTILTEYESLYRTHARAHVTSTITQLILDTITARSNLIDTFVILHAALVAALHKVVGVEFAAYFITRLVEELTKHYETLKKDSAKVEEGEEEGRGKECLNLTVLACELYNLHVVACPLIYVLIRMFLGSSSSAGEEGRVGEVDIELLLKTIRSCGHSLRQDDPTSLKSIIALTQARVASSPASSSLSTRTKFMLERMGDLQSSKKASAASNDASNPNSPSGQLLTRMKKYLGGLAKKRTVRSHEALRIGLKDLQDADKKGKWWLVGAAWTGQTDQGDAQGLTKLLPMNARANAIQSSSSSLEQSGESEEQQRLLELARAQGMNTDTRRTVFLTLITSEDYKQAAEQLLMLKLNDVQRREIIRVLVHCVGSESVYNPYYTLIGQEVCRNDHGMRITLQYCLWDFLREIGQKEVGGEKFAAALFTPDADEAEEGGKKVDPRRVSNLARAYAWWFTHDCLSLQALKTVDFTLVTLPRPAQFIGLLLIHIVLSLQAKSPAKTLHLPTVTAELKEGKLVKFMQSNLMGGSVDLTRGLLFFLNTKLDGRAQRRLILGEEKTGKEMREKMRPLLETVKEGLGVMVKCVQVIVQQQDGVAASPGGDDVELQSDSDDASVGDNL